MTLRKLALTTDQDGSREPTFESHVKINYARSEGFVCACVNVHECVSVGVCMMYVYG